MCLEIFDQVRFKPACSATEASQNLETLDKASIHFIVSKQRTIKVLIRLRQCTGWSAPLLFAYGTRHEFAWPGAFIGHPAAGQKSLENKLYKYLSIDKVIKLSSVVVEITGIYCITMTSQIISWIKVENLFLQRENWKFLNLFTFHEWRMLSFLTPAHGRVTFALQ